MAVVMTAYDEQRHGMYDGRAINHETPGGNGIKIALVTAVYTPDQNLHDFWNDVLANEVSGVGYTAGGNVLANGIVTKSVAGLITIDFDDPATWAQSVGGFTNARRAIAYLDTGVSTTSPLIGYSADFGADRNNVDGPYSITLDVNGLINSAR